MNKVDRVTYYYTVGLWSKKKLRDAVTKGWITQMQYELITGEAL